MITILSKIKKAGLVGRGGAGFPTAFKWSSVAKALEDKGNEKCYIICNAAEGEPGVKKDYYILTHFPERVIDGIKIALNFLSASNKEKKIKVKAFIYLNSKYFNKLAPRLRLFIKEAPIEIFKKPSAAGYIGGEETSVLNALEGRRIEPRLRPPYPTTHGLFGQPTLVNNVETFYDISLIAADEYDGRRFYTISGDCFWNGVYYFSENWTIEKILKETDNWPQFPFFVQVGGEAAGEVLNSRQLRRPVSGSGSITVYSLAKHKPRELVKKWVEFFYNQSCGQCTPCREGTYRLREILESKDPDWTTFNLLLENLTQTAFCGLGGAVPTPLQSFQKNVLPLYKK